MEKMIKVINDNLRNVISGIKVHRTDLESTLESIKSDMSLKVKEANAYKSDVETARAIVSTLEGEIADLEHDLEELNDKFGSKNFKEILAAGNREINAKIIEKRSAINEQGQIILGLTDKARSLKDTLIELRERKMVTEENLRKTMILESYYDTRISEIVKFSEESPEELATYREEIPQEELNLQEDIDISSVIDGSIFEEIDGITSGGEVDDEILRSALANPDEIPVYEPEENVEPVEIEVSTANQLENMISEAKSFVEKKKHENSPEEVKEEEKEEEEPKEETENTNEDLPDVKDEEKNVTDDKELDDATDDEDEADDGGEEFVDIYVDEAEETEEPEKINEDDEDIDPFLDIRGLQEELGLEEEGEKAEEEPEEEVIDLVVEEDKNEDEIEKEDLVSSEADFTSNENEDVESELSSMGLDINMFSVSDIDAVKKSFNKDNVKKFLEIMKKHDLSKDLVYSNSKVMTSVTPENLDQILTLLERTDAKRDDITLIYRYLDKVNVSRLEQVILSDIEPSLTVSLSEAMDEVDDVIASTLGLSRKAAEILKKTASPEDYKIMNALPEVVFENYREVKNLRVDNLEECISKYPHRFTLTHSKFHEILDKYDTDDLIRCINKNAAVIDKL